MFIQCTKKLLTELKIQPSPRTEEDPLFSWHANLITVARRKTLVLMNDLSRYVIILHGLKAKDFKKIDEWIVQAIRETFREENIKDEVIEAFLTQSKEITFTATKDRTSVARLNKACEHTSFFERELQLDSLIQTTMSKRVSRLMVGDGKKSYIDPNEELYRLLEERFGGPIFESEAIVLHVTLELEHHKVWRRLVVPKTMTFPELHKTLQTAFNWEDSHLHEFQLYASGPFSLEKGTRQEGRKPFLNLVSHEEALSYGDGTPRKMETGVKLVDCLPTEITYVYDFGDDWRHHIIVEKAIDDYEVNHPVCLAGEGDAPPEDVGGEPGYEHFLEVISDRTHPDYRLMREWGMSQGYQKFDLDMLNRGLKNV